MPCPSVLVSSASSLLLPGTSVFLERLSLMGRPLGHLNTTLPAESTASFLCRWHTLNSFTPISENVLGRILWERTTETAHVISALSRTQKHDPFSVGVDVRARRSSGLGSHRVWRREGVTAGLSVVMDLTSEGFAAQPEVWTWPDKHLQAVPWDHAAPPPPGLLHSLISPGRAQRGWGRAGVPQDSWLTGTL